MKKLRTGLLLLAILLSCSGALAQSDGYDTSTVFYDGDFVLSVAYAGGMVYTLRDSGLYSLAADGSEARIAPAYDFMGRIDILLSDGQALYGRSLFGPLPLVLLVDGAGQYANRSLLGQQGNEQRLTGQAAIRDGAFYTFSSSGSDPLITIYRLDTGETTSLSLPGITHFDVMADGQLIALRQEIRWPDVINSLIRLDPWTGESTPWAKVDSSQRLQRLMYDSSTKTAYLFGETQILSVKEGGSAQAADGFIRGDLMSAALLDHGAALVVDGILVIRNFADAGSATARRLTILEANGRGEDYRGFIEAHPQIDLQFAGSLNQSPDERFSQDMITRNDDIDVYILSDLNLLRQIKEKGYYVDMAADAEIKGLVDDMYVPFSSAITMQGKIIAFPKQAFLETLCYHKESFQTHGLTPPSTYEEYFDFCINWLSNYVDDYPDIILNPFTNNLSLETLFTHYADERARGGEPLRYNTGNMARLVEKYLALREAWEAGGDDGRSGTSLFYNYAIPLLGDDDAYAYLPLRFDRDAQPLISPGKDELEYFVINSYGKNPQDALAFVAASESQRLEVQTALLYQSIDWPMESAYFKSERATQERKLDSLEAMLEKAEPWARREVEAQIKQHKLMMEGFESTSRWAVSQSALDVYKYLAGLVYINDFNPVMTLYTSTPDFFDGAKTLSIPLFLEILDSKINLILLENGIKEIYR